MRKTPGAFAPGAFCSLPPQPQDFPTKGGKTSRQGHPAPRARAFRRKGRTPRGLPAPSLCAKAFPKERGRSRRPDTGRISARRPFPPFSSPRFLRSRRPVTSGTATAYPGAVKEV